MLIETYLMLRAHTWRIFDLELRTQFIQPDHWPRPHCLDLYFIVSPVYRLEVIIPLQSEVKFDRSVLSETKSSDQTNKILHLQQAMDKST